jgi:predicted TIM-barrel fold metal-dependent hydrolase
MHVLVIDCQVHPFLAQSPQRPWANPHDDGRRHVTADEMVMAMDAVGVDGAIAVSPRGMYGFDPSYVVEVQRAHPDRFAIVRPVDPENPAVGETIAEWKRTAGAVAVRLMIGSHLGFDPSHPGANVIAKEAARQGLPVNFQCSGNLDAAMGLIDRHPETRFVIDHLGTRQPRKSPATAEAWADLPKLLELAKRPNAAVKVSGACTMSAQPYPHDDIWDNLQRVFDAWGLDRCLWGTDWTRTYPLFPYINGVDPFRLSKRLSESDKAKLMGETCAKVYGWKPKSSYRQRHPKGTTE